MLININMDQLSGSSGDLDTPLWCIEVFLISIYKKMDTDKIPADEL
jgi:hypothetical protein